MDSLGEGAQSRGSRGADRGLRAHRFALILATALFVAPPPSAAFAQEAPPRAAALHDLLDDARQYVTAPVHWRAHEWERFGEGVALVLAAHAADDRLLRGAQRLGHDSFFRNVTPFGGGRGEELTFVLIGA